MHGLCTHGFACRALMASLTPGKPELVRRLACRFSRPLYPGDPIRTLIWKTAEGKAVWRTINSRTNETVIDCGVFEYGEIPKDEIRFDGRVAIVTGAGGGLGRVYALEFAKRGAKVLVNDLGGARDGSGEGSQTPAQKVVEEIKAAGGVAVANYDNVATAEGGERIVKAALDAFGTVDILVNNAGILRDKSLPKMEPETWQAVLDVHLNGAYNVTRPAFAVMKEKGYGRIIMTTSAAGLYGNFGQTNYSAAKMGLVGLMNTLKLEGAKYNIKVNTIAPIAASRLMADIIPPELLDKMKPEFVAPLVLYLASEGCPVTGRIYNAGVGYYGRAAVMTSPGTVIGDGKKVPTVEEVGAAWEKIQSLQGAKELGQLNDLMGDMLTAFAAGPQKAAPAAASGPPAQGAPAVRRRADRLGRRGLREDASGLPGGEGRRGERRLPVLHLRRGRRGVVRRNQGRNLQGGGGKALEPHLHAQDRRGRFPGPDERETPGDGGLHLGEAQDRRRHHEVAAYRQTLQNVRPQRKRDCPLFDDRHPGESRGPVNL